MPVRGRRAQMCSVEMCPWRTFFIVNRVEEDLLQREGGFNEALGASVMQADVHWLMSTSSRFSQMPCR